MERLRLRLRRPNIARQSHRIKLIKPLRIVLLQQLGQPLRNIRQNSDAVAFRLQRQHIINHVLITLIKALVVSRDDLLDIQKLQTHQ